jgi:pimeloyl-ACP methyl ester carboxylesterase
VVEHGFPIGAPIGETPLVMRMTGVRALGRLLARMPLNDRMVRSMLSQIGLRQALAAGRVPQVGIDWFKAMINHTDTMRNDIEAAPPVMHPIRGVDDSILLTDEVLARIRTPMHFLWGAEDPFGGETVARAFVAMIPGAELEVVPGAGHAVWLDDPERAAEATARFLAAGDGT